MTHCPTIPQFRSECPPKIWLGEGLQQVFLELTPFCNNSCPGCLNESFIEEFPNRKLKSEFYYPPLSKTSWLDILSKFPKSLKSVILSGGEPALHPDFFPILEELENREYQITIFTNGRWPDPDKLISFLKTCQHFNGFLISLHGISAASHEAFSGKVGSFDETVCNIRKATHAGLSVTLSTVITLQNLDELSRMPKLASELKAEGISFNRYLYTPERVIKLDKLIASLTPIQLKIAMRQIEALQIKFENQVHIEYGPTIPQCFVQSTSHGCSAGDASLVVDPWGNIKPCLHVDLLCGNILEQEFEEVRSNENLIKWRDLSTESCSNCSAFSICGGGCKAMALTWGNNQDPLMNEQMPNNFIQLSELARYK